MIHLERRKDIDGLRGVAIMLVVLFHAFPDTLSGGFIGVDVFFVISGFLISKIMLSELKLKSFSFAQFYMRRARRLLPALSFMIAGCYLLGICALMPDELHELVVESRWGVFFSGNLYFMKLSQSYFETDNAWRPMQHLWSLGVEEQFYLLWPLVIFIGWKYKKIMWLIGLLAITSFAWGLSHLATEPQTVFFSPCGRIWQFALGATLAWIQTEKKDLWSKRWGSFGHKTAPWVGFVGLIMILLAAVSYDGAMPYPGQSALLPTLGACMVIAAGDPWRFKFLETKLMQGLGAISYPLYLWHWPLLAYSKLVSESEPWTQWLWIAISISLSVITVKYIEILFNSKWSLKNSATWAVSCLGVVALASLAVIQMEENKERPIVGRSASDAKLLENLNQLKWFKADQDCLNELDLNQEQAIAGEALFCSWRKEDGSPKVVVFGDSAANHLYPGMKKIYAKKNKAVLNVGNGTCSPFRGQNGHHGYNNICKDVNKKIYHYILNHPEIEVVILGFAPWDIKNMDMQGLDLNANIVEKFKFMEKQASKDIIELENSGKKVIATFTAPSIGMDPRRCLRKAVDCIAKKAYASTGDSAMIYAEQWNEKISLIKNVCIFDQRNAMMTGVNDARVTFNRLLLFRDDHHLSVYGSEYLADYFEKSSCY